LRISYFILFYKSILYDWIKLKVFVLHVDLYRIFFKQKVRFTEGFYWREQIPMRPEFNNIRYWHYFQSKTLRQWVYGSLLVFYFLILTNMELRFTSGFLIKNNPKKLKEILMTDLFHWDPSGQSQKNACTFKRILTTHILKGFGVSFSFRSSHGRSTSLILHFIVANYIWLLFFGPSFWRHSVMGQLLSTYFIYNPFAVSYF